MIRSLKFQMLTNMRNVAVICLITLAFIPYTFLIAVGDLDLTSYYLGMVCGIFMVMSFILPFTSAATLVRLALGYGATRRGWFWANVLTTVVSQAVACAMVLFVAAPLGGLVFTGATETVRDILAQTLPIAPLVFLLSLAVASMSETAGYIMSRFNGKVLIFVILIAVGILITFSTMLVLMLGFEYIISNFSIPLALVVCTVLCIVFHAVSWRLIHKLPAA